MLQDISLYQVAFLIGRAFFTKPKCWVRTNKNLGRILSRAVDLMWINFSKGHPLYSMRNWLWGEEKKLREYTGGHFNSTGPEKIINWKDSLVAQTVKNPPAMRETWFLSLGWEDSPGKRNGYPLRYSCLENSMLRGAWRAAVHAVTERRAWLSNFHFQCS